MNTSTPVAPPHAAPDAASGNVDWELGSFRDPRSRVYYADGAVYRGLSERGLADYEALAKTGFFAAAMEDGSLVQTELADASAAQPRFAGTLKHERLPFVSYPYEWSFGMLQDAALVQLDLLSAALAEEITLKDGSAYNTQWRGTKPVFIDIGSFHPHKGEPWIGYEQFCRQMLFPLFLMSYKGVPFQPWMRGSLEGISPAEMAGLMSKRDWLRKGVLGNVVMHSMLQAKYDGDTKRDVGKEMKDAGFGRELLQANVKKWRKIVSKLDWSPHGVWVSYRDNNTYDDEQARTKQAFVRTACEARSGGMVWDLGCNDGLYSRIAAESADYVIALDFDHGTIEHLYRELKAEGNEKILPLVSNLVDPSPGLGWRGTERTPLTERGTPDVILALALIHHVCITGHIPIPSFLDWLLSIGSNLVIEFPTEDDPMVQRLVAAKPDGHHEYTIATFDKALKERFNVIDERTDGTRVLYHCSAQV
jgi:hypothetical protein